MASKSNKETIAQPKAEVEQPEIEQPAADEAVADAPAAEEAAEPEQSIDEACAELGIAPDADGNVELELLTSLAGANVKAKGETHTCDAAEAVRMVRAGFAKPRG